MRATIFGIDAERETGRYFLNTRIDVMQSLWLPELTFDRNREPMSARRA